MPASISLAVFLAVPSTSPSIWMNWFSCSMFPPSCSPAREPRRSNMLSAKESLSAVGILFIARAMSAMMAGIERRLPFPSTVLMFSSASFFLTSVLANWL